MATQCLINGQPVTVIRHDPESYTSRAAWHSVIGRNAVIAQAGPMLPQAGTLVIDCPDKTFRDWLIDQVKDTSQYVFETPNGSPVWADGTHQLEGLTFSPFVDGAKGHKTATLRYQKIGPVPSP